MDKIIADIVGLVGVAGLIYAYFMLNAGKWQSDGWNYMWFNLIAASMILYSLLWSFNLASFIIEIFWISITLYGMYRRITKDKNGDENTDESFTTKK